MEVSRLMSAHVVTVLEGSSCCDAVRLMVERGIRHLPVVDRAGRLRGIVTMRDLRHYLFEPEVFKRIGAVSVDRVLRAVPVREVMSAPVVTIPPDAPAEEAARRMLEERVGSLAVVADDRLLGVITETDLLRCVVGADEASPTSEAVVVSYP